MSEGAPVSERAAELHRRALIFNGLAGSSALPAGRDGDWDLPQIMRDGGITSANLTVALNEGFHATSVRFSNLLRAIDRHDGVHVARTVDDILAAKEEGGVAIAIGFQNSDPLEGNLAYLDLFHRLGLRIVQLTYQRRNLVADGGGEPANGGLSIFGRELVAELNRLGILIDLSHTGVRSTLETIELSADPVSITHACLQHFTPVARNATDEEVKALAGRGGVFGMNAIARLISPTGRQEGATVEQLVDQIDYLVELVGVDHIGIGLDINEGMTPEVFDARRKGFLTEFPELTMGGDFPFEHYYAFGLTSMRHVDRITDALVRRGYGDDDVIKILGGNFVRLLRAVWK
jgi:membrane dipeptidase